MNRLCLWMIECAKPLFLLLLVAFVPLTAQEQVDKSDARGKGSAVVKKLAVRVRVTKSLPEQKSVRVVWRRGGEGLGGVVVRGEFTNADKKQPIAIGEWTAWLPLNDIVANLKGWDFPSIVVTSEPIIKGKNTSPGVPLTDVIVDFEFSENGRVIKGFTEVAPKGATVGFAFPGAALGLKSNEDKVSPEFVAQLNGLSAHARNRRERLEKLFPDVVPLPKYFGIIGHMGGYGEGPPGLRGGSGYGTRHCNPAILADEFRTLELLGVNGMVDSLRLADAAGVGGKFRSIYWGGPGSGDPMAFFQKPGKVVEMPDGCPYDPDLKTYVMNRVATAIEEHQKVGARDSWALWDDEMGVYAKEHIARCERCRDVFRDYLKSQKVSPQDLGKKSWEEVVPYNVWLPSGASAKGGKSAPSTGLAPVPDNPGDALRYYYTYRMMSHANGQVFPEAARKFKESNISLYAMQGPTPSWNGSSLDWHEFYDLKPNTAFVFETSNRDARIWQWESYLADIGRGIANRHEMVMGCLVKPHRGAVAQRMLTVVGRGTKALEWYTYGPDYSKGDSFSQSLELLEQVARAARFLGLAEPYLYGAKFLKQPEVAFVSPRSTEIWSRATDISLTSFENAKWVYLALMHANIPVDILSEQQLAEGKLEKYKVIYIPGTHLRRDAGKSVREWVKAGGTIFTDAFGLARDEANQKVPEMNEMLGLADRSLKTWGSVEQYRATDLKPLAEMAPPALEAELKWNDAKLQARIGRESLDVKTAEVLATFADGKPAVTRNRFGKGEAVVAGLWTGITYSAKVRRNDFDMQADFDPALRSLVAMPAINSKVYRPAPTNNPLVETIALTKDGKRSVSLINWSYNRPAGETSKGILQTIENLQVDLSGMGAVKSVRSIVHGPLGISNGIVKVPKMAEIDLLVID